MTVTTRFAPSPTGLLHIGGARTALFSYLYAKKNNGQFLLRIEDTDVERSTPESVQAIFDGMAWLGLKSDKPAIFQTHRYDRYKELAHKLLSEGNAYWCYMSSAELEIMKAKQHAAKEKPKYNGFWRPEIDKVLPPIPDGVKPVLRFKNPLDGTVLVNDLIKGDIVFQNKELDDLIILRSDGTPTYNFCVVVDDFDMGISHVVRGDDHVNNTPRQINILKALGATLPVYAHVPMILDKDGKKVSKRDGAASILNYREAGYLPAAVLNYLSSLGWSSENGEEVFTLDELIKNFDIQRVQSSPARLNNEKLNWFNLNHIKKINQLVDEPVTRNELMYHFDKKGLTPDLDVLQKIFDLQKERTSNLVELVEKSIFFFTAPTEYHQKDLDKHLSGKGIDVLQSFIAKIKELDTWDKEAIHTLLFNLAKDLDVKIPQVMQPIRIALVGYAISPPVDAIVFFLGKDECLKRVENLINHLEPKKSLTI